MSSLEGCRSTIELRPRIFLLSRLENSSRIPCRVIFAFGVSGRGRTFLLVNYQTSLPLAAERHQRRLGTVLLHVISGKTGGQGRIRTFEGIADRFQVPSSYLEAWTISSPWFLNFRRRALSLCTFPAKKIAGLGSRLP